MKKIAILCCGLDKVRRGYETHTRLLFNKLQEEDSAEYRYTLFKRWGKRKPNEERVWSPFRSSLVCKILAVFRGTTFYWEIILFSLRFVWRTIVLRRKFEKIITIEPICARVVSYFQKWLPGKPPIVFSHTVNNEPAEYAHTADIYQQMNHVNHRKMDEYLANKGIKGKRNLLIPHFILPVSMEASKIDLRKKYGIKTDKVLLAVGTIESIIKRMHYVIDDAKQLPNDWTLVICGSIVEQDLFEKAKKELGERFVHLYLKPELMPEAYKLADAFVLGSLWEGFGIVNIEAMRAGLLVVTNDDESFRFILKGKAYHTDLKVSGNLARILIENEKDLSDENLIADRKKVGESYFWTSLREKYLDMIRN